ncbi:MAG: protoporphyrinogen oxidase [Rhodobacteraceae bacterium]|nr:MAG: protoporphyrinogen oxidase [Paracoccaceae bacterium]
MKVLVFYATIEGQTGKIARFVADELETSGHEVTLVDAADMTAEVTPEEFDRVILAGSVHERRHPRLFEMFLAAQRNALDPARTLLISVSLMAAFESSRNRAQDFVDEMEMRTGFTPASVALVAGAVRPSSYDYFATQVVRHIVMRGKSYRPEDGDREFTDWAALRARVAEFMAA